MKDLERVKFSVQQFGLQAYTPEERRKIERDRLIRLGAKAPKKEWKNYKGKEHLTIFSFSVALKNRFFFRDVKINFSLDKKGQFFVKF